MSYWNVEKPAHAMASVYGNRWLSVGRHYADEEGEDFYNVNIRIDAHGLTFDETNFLVGALDDIALYRCKDDWEGYTGKLKLTCVETDDDDDYYHVFTLKGSVTSEIYDEICNVLDEFNGKIKVKWQ